MRPMRAAQQAAQYPRPALALLRPGASRQGAFSLVELMGVLAIAGIVAGFAIPSFNSMLSNNTRTERLNSMIAAMKLARNEAVTKKVSVTLCASESPYSACTNPRNGAFETGWIVLRDGETVREFATPAGEDGSVAGDLFTWEKRRPVRPRTS